jgi:GTP-binding protein
MAHRFLEYKPWKGPIPGRNNGVLLSKNQDKTTAYSIDKLQERGTFFVDPGEDVYAMLDEEERKRFQKMLKTEEIGG